MLHLICYIVYFNEESKQTHRYPLMFGYKDAIYVEKRPTHKFGLNKNALRYDDFNYLWQARNI